MQLIMIIISGIISSLVIFLLFMLSFKVFLLVVLIVILGVRKEKVGVRAIIKAEQELYITSKVCFYFVVGLAVFFFYLYYRAYA